jgi:histidyl-tRNA synthetase
MIGKRIGKDVPACGFSIGFERIVDIMLENAQKQDKREKLAIIFDPEKDDVKAAYLRVREFEKEKFCVVSVLRKEKKYGRQLKKLLELGFTHYGEFFEHNVYNIMPLELKE